MMPLPTYWGWCGCHIWPLILGQPVGKCGWCRRKPIFLADDISTTPGGVTKDDAELVMLANLDELTAQLEEANAS